MSKRLILLLAFVINFINIPANACNCVSELIQGVKQIDRTSDSDKSQYAKTALFCYLSENEERYKNITKADGSGDIFGIIEVSGNGSYDKQKIEKAREQYCSAESRNENIDKLTTNLKTRFDQYSLRAVQSCLNSCQSGGLFCNITSENDEVTTVSAKWHPVGGVNDTKITGASVTGGNYIKPIIGDNPLVGGASIGSQGVNFIFEKKTDKDLVFNLQTSGGTCSITSKQPELTVAVQGKIWAVGTERRVKTGSFNISYPKDEGTCSRRTVDLPIKRCPALDGQKMIIEDVWQANYKGNDAKVRQIPTNNNSCVTAYITSIDAGRGTVGDCRGRTWLDSLDIFYRGYSNFSAVETPKVDFSGEAFLDANLDASFSATYPKTTIEKFSGLTWRYELNISEKVNGRTLRSFTMNSSNNKFRDYEANISDGQISIVKK